MENEFIPYEQALELKELGFDEPCLMYYDYLCTLVESGVYECKAPLYQQVFRWFKEKYGVYFYKKNSLKINGVFPHHTIMYNYVLNGGDEENAELECVKELISIVKNKYK
jgi:hypothetical protein